MGPYLVAHGSWSRTPCKCRRLRSNEEATKEPFHQTELGGTHPAGGARSPPRALPSQPPSPRPLDVFGAGRPASSDGPHASTIRSIWRVTVYNSEHRALRDCAELQLAAGHFDLRFWLSLRLTPANGPLRRSRSRPRERPRSDYDVRTLLEPQTSCLAGITAPGARLWLQAPAPRTAQPREEMSKQRVSSLQNAPVLQKNPAAISSPSWRRSQTT